MLILTICPVFFNTFTNEMALWVSHVHEVSTDLLVAQEFILVAYFKQNTNDKGRSQEKNCINLSFLLHTTFSLSNVCVL
jgi:hypothetical protein